MAHLYSHTHIPKSGWSCPAAVGGTDGLPSSVISYSRTTFFFSFMIISFVIYRHAVGGWVRGIRAHDPNRTCSTAHPVV